MEEYDKKNNKLSQYLGGFNKGYMISRAHPDIADGIKDITSDAPFMRGIIDGNKQFVLDKVKSQRPHYLKSDSSEMDKSSDKQPSKDKPQSKEATKAEKNARSFERE